MREIIEMFIAQIPEFIENMNASLKNKQYIELGKEAHKAKSSVMVMGLNDLGLQLKELQLLTEQRAGIERYRDYVDDFIRNCNQAKEELEEFLKDQ
jgi:HPt (histidine-containing phosphotransfer) domain-containing protein